MTGGTGYIGKRLLPVLLEQGHTVICCTRNAARLELDPSWDVLVFEHDFLDPVTAPDAPLDFEIAFYLLHSMSASIRNFEPLSPERMKELHVALDPFFKSKKLPWMQPGYFDGMHLA